MSAPLPPLSRRLAVGGLGVWGLGIGAALAPGALRAIVWPHSAEALPFDLVAARPIGAPVLWAAFFAWSVSWAFVAGYVSAISAGQEERRSWALRTLVLSSLASPLVFGIAVSVLLRRATQDAWSGDGILSYLPAASLQLAVSWAYSSLGGLRPFSRAPVPGGQGTGASRTGG